MFNNKKTIYLDYQATTPVDPRVLEVMLPFFNENFGNPHSVDHSVGWKAAADVERSQQVIANLVGADTDEVIFTSGATESNNLAIFGVCRGNSNLGRRRILISEIEHKCVLASANALQESEGFKVEHLPVSKEGFVDLIQFQQR